MASHVSASNYSHQHYLGEGILLQPPIEVFGHKHYYNNWFADIFSIKKYFNQCFFWDQATIWWNFCHVTYLMTQQIFVMST